MNKLFFTFAIGGLVMIGGGLWLYSSMSDSSSDDPTPATPVERTPFSLADILASGQNLTCNFAFQTDTVRTEGRAFIESANERIRADFTQQLPAVAEVHIIRDAGLMYMWATSLSEGTQAKVTPENHNKLFEFGSNTAPTDVVYDCAQWDVNEAVFYIPSDVTFAEVGADGEKLKKEPERPTVAPPTEEQCAVCDKSGKKREQCRVALNCE